MLTTILDLIRKESANPIFFSYRKIRVSKKKGGKRTISIPSEPLRKSQRLLLSYLKTLPVSNSAHGFIDGKSIISHAQLHVSKESILTLDIEDFFGSVKITHLESLFRKNGLNNDNDIAFLLRLTTLEGKLPQGAPTSPALSNAVAFEMDCELEKWAQQNDLVYSRYADDMVFSSEIKTIQKSFVDEIAKIILKYGFLLNNSKTRILHRSKRQIVTGLVVNTKLNIKREYLRNTSAILHNILIDPQKALNQLSRESVFKDYLTYKTEYLSRRLSPVALHNLRIKQSAEQKLINPTNIRLNVRNYHFQNLTLFRLLLLLQGVHGRISFIASVVGEERNTVRKLRNKFRKIEKMLFGEYQINWATRTGLLFKKVVKDVPQIRVFLKVM